MKKFAASITAKDISLFGLLKVINNAPSGIAFIEDSDHKLCGVITDGDVRRWLLQGYNLDSSLTDIEMEPFTYAKVGDNLETILAKTNNKIRMIPLVNDHMELVDYIQLDRRVNIPVASPDLKGNELRYLTDALLSSWISSSGKYITRFEEGFAAYCGTKYGVATSNGTVAIHLALVALGVGKGDEVIVPDLTFAATINAVIHAGAIPVIVDVELDSWCIDPIEIEKAITPKTKAIIPVHIYGQPCDMICIMDIAKRYDLFVIEDCAEAHGATINGQKVGSFGDINTFSFYANKIITTGEGGICLTNNKALDDRMRVIRDHGMSKTKRYWHEMVGYNYRMTNLQAAIGCAQLERINEIIEQRAELEINYKKILSKCSFIEFQQNFENGEKTVWLISLLIKEATIRMQFMSFFKSHNVDIRPFFYPLSNMPIYKNYISSPKETWNSCTLSDCGINLPTFTNVNLNKFESVVKLFEEQYLQKQTN